METIILIVILKLGNSDALSSTVVEFTSIEACSVAARQIKAEVDEASYANVISLGCYKK